MKVSRLFGIGWLAIVVVAQMADRARGQVVGGLTIASQFNANAGGLVGVGFDQAGDRIWLYPDFGAELRSYSRAGVFAKGVARPGEAANDADVDFARASFTLKDAIVPAGSILFFNGETGPAEVYAVSRDTGAVISTLTTAFGVSHVVGGAFHAQRGTLFLVADKLDGVNPSTIAEINPVTGAVIRTFGTGSSDYTINYGDLAIGAYTGDIFLVSSDETSIRQLTAEGAFVRDVPLPTGVTSLSGIAIDDVRNEAIASGTDGTVWILGGIYGAPVLTIRYVGNGQVEVCWNARPGRRYILQRRSSLNAGEWTNYEMGIDGIAGQICRTEITIGTSTMYYRLQEDGVPTP